jgi:hypothetical protein
MGDELRLFDNAAIQEAVNRELAALPDDAHGAVLAYADKDKARMAIVARLGAGWSLVTTVEREWTGDWDGSAQIRWAW